GEIVVLLLDLDVALGEVAVLVLHLMEPLEHVGALALEALDARQQLAAQLLPGVLVGGGQLLPFDARQLAAQALVLAQQLLGELGALAEQPDHLLGPGEQSFPLLAHAAPLRDACAATPDSMTVAICASGSTASTTPVRIACCGIPNTTAVSSDSATTRPPASFTAATPRRPSSPIPVSTIASRSLPPSCLATEANSRSTDGAYLSPGAASPSRTTVRPPARSNSRWRPPGAISTC